MKKIFLTLALSLTLMGAKAQLLYKISGNGLEKPSYVIGTYHFGNTTFAERIPGVKEALTETDQVYGELIFDDILRPDTIAMMTQAMQLPEGKTLKDVLSADQYDRLNAFLRRTMGNDLNASATVTQAMAHLTPMALANQIEVLLIATHGIARIDPTTTFDQYFQAQAKVNNMPVGGLETAAGQAKLLYNTIPLDRQAITLMCLIDNEDATVQMLKSISDAFYAMDLDALDKAMNEKLNNSCDATPEEQEILIYSRNQDWASRMPAIMQQSPTFFAVGAAHLTGAKGLLQLLKDKGYQVEGVK